jgi:hypothetical protein
MEQSGRNPWQPVTSRTAARTAQTSPNRCRGLRLSPIGAHGKEGVDGSRPSEGSAKGPHAGLCVCVQSVPRPLRAWMEPFMELSRRECALTRLAFLAGGVETGPRLLRVGRLRLGFNGRRLSRRRVAVAVDWMKRSQDVAGAPIAYSAGEVGLVPRLGAARRGCCSRLGFARTAPARTGRRARSTSLDSATNSSLRIRPAHWGRRASSLCGVGSAG